MKPGPNKEKWTKDAVYNDLKKKIILQDLEAGAPLTESRIMQEYAIGRTPLREILLDLKKDRFVQMIPNRGTFVCPMDINEMKHAMEMRVPLEILAVKLSIDHISNEEIESLENILIEAGNINPENKQNYRKLLLLESEFHNKIYSTTHNELLCETMFRIQAISIRFWIYLTKHDEDLSSLFDELESLLDSIKKKDKNIAVSIIEKHTTRSHELLKQYI